MYCAKQPLGKFKGMTGETGRNVCATRKTQSLKTVSRQKALGVGCVNITQPTSKTQAQTIYSICNLVVWSLKPQVSIYQILGPSG